MKERQRRKQNLYGKEVMSMIRNLLMLSIFMAVIAVGSMVFSTDAQAVVDCAAATSADTDSDGYTDAEECTGLTLLDGTVVSNCANGTGTAGCMDPNAKDVFVIVAPAAASNLPVNPLEYTASLGIKAHQIMTAQASATRNITTAQKAIKITESLDTSETILGISNYGTPNGLDGATIFTQRIINYVSNACAGATTCADSTGTFRSSQALITHHIKNTIAHEIGHVVSLTSVYNSRFGGNHYKTGTGVVMDQSTWYTSKGGAVTFYIPNVWASVDPADAKLK